MSLSVRVTLRNRSDGVPTNPAVQVPSPPTGTVYTRIDSLKSQPMTTQPSPNWLLAVVIGFRRSRCHLDDYRWPIRCAGICFLPIHRYRVSWLTPKHLDISPTSNHLSSIPTMFSCSLGRYLPIIVTPLTRGGNWRSAHNFTIITAITALIII